MRLFARASNGQSVVLVHGTLARSACGTPFREALSVQASLRKPHKHDAVRLSFCVCPPSRQALGHRDPSGAGRHVQAMGWWDQFVNSNDTSICEGAWKVLFLFKVQHQRLQ